MNFYVGTGATNDFNPLPARLALKISPKQQWSTLVNSGRAS